MSPIASTFSTLGRAVGSFHPRAMPWIARANYRREILAWAFLPIMVGAVEGGVVGVLAKNLYTGVIDETLLNFAVAVITGAHAFANVTSLAWAALSHGRHKIRFLYLVQTIMVGLVVMIAFAPRSGLGLTMMILGVVGARICWAGVAAIRTTVWRANYSRHYRARIAGKLATVQSIVVATTGVILGASVDAHSDAFRLIYPLAAVCGLIGARIYRRMRVRGHRSLLSAEQAGEASDRPALRPRSFLRVLVDDRRFGMFMGCHFVFGIGNMMSVAPLVYVLKDRFAYGSLAGILITTTIPVMMMPLSIPLWAKLLDQTHIIRFRAFHSWAYVTTLAVMLPAAVLTFAPLLWLAAVLRGLAFGGGVLAWNLGHHDFASTHQASEYMGVHMTLTGIRGFISMVLPWAIYEGFEAMHPGAGPWVFAVCLGLAVTGATGFVVLNRVTSRSEQ